MQLKHILAGGCGTTTITINLLDDSTFNIEYQDHWMGIDKLVLIIKGKYDSSTNNYYWLNIENIFDVYKQENIAFDGALGLELIVLNSSQILNKDDEFNVFIELANCGIFNNRDRLFNAVTYYHKNSLYQHKNNKNIKAIMKVFQGCKFYLSNQ